jgi:hypothetical protein
MNIERYMLELDESKALLGGGVRRSRVSARRRLPVDILKIWLLLLIGYMAQNYARELWSSKGWPVRPRLDQVAWTSCEEGSHEFQCANITVPLDYRNGSDPRTIKAAVAKFTAADQARRKGSIFLNPRGPGE